MSQLQKLYDLRAESAKTIQSLRDDMPEGGWTPEQHEHFDRAYADFNKYSKDIENFEKSENMIKNFDEDLFTQEKAKKGETPKYKDVFEKWCRKQRLNSEEQGVLDSGFRNVDGKIQNPQNALSTTVGAGGYTIPEEWATSVYESMSYFGPFGMTPGQGVGNVISTNGGGQLHFPRTNDTANSGRQLSEGGDASSGTTDPTYTEMTLDAYNYTSDLIKVSNQLLQDTGVDFAPHLGGLLGERLGRIFNSDLTNGLGATGPKGITHAATLYDATAATGAITQAEVRGLKYSVDRAYRQGPQVGFMMHDSTVSYILGLDTSTSNYSQPLWQPSFQAGEPDRILGDRYYVNNDLAELSDAGGDLMLYGDWSKFFIRIVNGIQLIRLDERYAELYQTAWVGFMRFDSDLIDAAAIKYLKEDAT